MQVKPVGYSSGQTDLIGPLTSAGAQTADMVIPYSSASGCVNLAKGLKQLGDHRLQEDRLGTAVPQLAR